MSGFGDAGDRPLFTPGPLTTSRTVKHAMLRDLGSRDEAFVAIVADIRERLLAIGEVSQEAGWEAVIMQGSGTFGIEATLTSAVPADGRLLVLANGAYGERMLAMAHQAGIPVDIARWPEDAPVDAERAAAEIASRTGITHVAVVHCETTTGIMNPIDDIAAAVREAGCSCIVDSMSAFGGVPTSLAETGIDFLVSSSNKCIEGVPGFSFVLARRDALEHAAHARSLSLDLLAQWRGLERNGQFRFTPPTHALLAFHQALIELEAEGGVAARNARYRANQAVLMEAMTDRGIRCVLAPEVQGPIIASFAWPDDPAFTFEAFYRGLGERGFVIYPGKLARVDCFRIGSIGRLFARDVRALVHAIDDTLSAMGVSVNHARGTASD